MKKIGLLAPDLLGVGVLAVLTLLFVFVPPLNETPLRVVFGLPFVLFLPGYSLIAALFPKRDDLEGIERLALSFGLSIAVVPLIGLILNYTPFGIRLAPVGASLSIFILAMVVTAEMRRRHIPDEERFQPTMGFGWVQELRSETGLDRALSILLVLSILSSLIALVYVIATPKQGERFTEFYILGEGGRAADYPRVLEVGARGTVIVGVVNNEFEVVNYTLKVVLENSTLYGQEIFLGHNETWEEPVDFSPDKGGLGQKLEFLLFKNSLAEPYRELHLWIDVE